MAYFKQCPYCGANLDPEERCDCSQDGDRQEYIDGAGGDSCPAPRHKEDLCQEGEQSRSQP